MRIGIESDIFAGRLVPGEVLDEMSMAERYGVSRTPVREAIASLVRGGLLEKAARTRAKVAELDATTLLNLFEVLAELEALSARLAAERMTTAELAQLTANHERARKVLESGEDAEQYAALGREFHRLILEGAANDTLEEMTATLANRLVPYRRYQVMAPGRLQRNQDDHDHILAAISQGDAANAFARMHAHAIDQGNALLRFIGKPERVRSTAREAINEADK